MRRGKRLSIDVSLSHDGPFIACAFSNRGGCARPGATATGVCAPSS
jgi:hypothetical protein